MTSSRRIGQSRGRVLRPEQEYDRRRDAELARMEAAAEAESARIYAEERAWSDEATEALRQTLGLGDSR